MAFRSQIRTSWRRQGGASVIQHQHPIVRIGGREDFCPAVGELAQIEGGAALRMEPPAVNQIRARYDLGHVRFAAAPSDWIGEA